MGHRTSEIIEEGWGQQLKLKLKLNYLNLGFLVAGCARVDCIHRTGCGVAVRVGGGGLRCYAACIACCIFSRHFKSGLPLLYPALSRSFLVKIFCLF